MSPVHTHIDIHEIYKYMEQSHTQWVCWHARETHILQFRKPVLMCTRHAHVGIQTQSKHVVQILKDPVKQKSECDLLVYVECFQQKQASRDNLSWILIDVHSSQQGYACPPSANIAVCEYKEQCNQSTTGLYKHHGMMLWTQARCC